MSGRQTVRDADTGLQTCVHVGDLKELADRLRESDDSCMYFGCWDGPECDGCPAYNSPYDCSGAMAHDAADRIDAAITRGVFAGGTPDAVDELKLSGCPEAGFTLRHDALEAFEWVEEHGGLEVMRRELPVIAYRASLVGSVYDALEIDPDEPGAAMLLSSEVKRLRDDHDAMLWIDEHGGIDEVEAEWEYAHDRTGLANSVAVRLGVDPLTDADISEKVMDELDRRLMPDSCEWPRYESGEPVAFGDEVTKNGEEFGVGAFEVFSDGSYILNFRAYSKGERVKRPAPKVLDADGVEVELGDDLYSVEGSLKFHVSHVDRANGKIATDAMFAIDKWADPSLFTHRAPVLAADGLPLRVGDTVYHVDTGIEYSVRSVTNGGAHLSKGDKPGGYCRADYLTHERPESWERIEGDIERGKTYTDEAVLEFVRRARALAERGQ